MERPRRVNDLIQQGDAGREALSALGRAGAKKAHEARQKKKANDALLDEEYRRMHEHGMQDAARARQDELLPEED